MTLHPSWTPVLEGARRSLPRVARMGVHETTTGDLKAALDQPGVEGWVCLASDILVRLPAPQAGGSGSWTCLGSQAPFSLEGVDLSRLLACELRVSGTRSIHGRWTSGNARFWSYAELPATDPEGQEVLVLSQVYRTTVPGAGNHHMAYDIAWRHTGDDPSVRPLSPWIARFTGWRA